MPKIFTKDNGFQMVAGGCAGCVEVAIMHPLDLIKTRLQIQSNATLGSAHHYNGIGDCIGKMYKHEGLKSFWKGIIPPLCVETPKRAWKFGTYEIFKGQMGYTRDGSMTLGQMAAVNLLAGMGSGVSEAIIVNPFEVVKVRMQSNRAHQSERPSTWKVAAEIARQDGMGRNGLLGKGMTATIGRNGAFNTIYFGFFYTVVHNTQELDNKWLELGRKFALGFTAGTLASCFNIPFDVAKSRIQGPQPEAGKIMYQGTLRTIGMVYSQEGFKALYKGLLPKILRLGPGGAIMLIVKDYVFDILKAFHMALSIHMTQVVVAMSHPVVPITLAAVHMTPVVVQMTHPAADMTSELPKSDRIHLDSSSNWLDYSPPRGRDACHNLLSSLSELFRALDSSIVESE
eukprot:maker-scaffold69_size418775-snap-gene-3.29 protein:Tk03266 transcript:maker-scaffold69_size418775-snap-gene-3.29-mRNA-1 annotation:"mitochondrial 2-oxodicarboxylate carrier"